MPILPDRSSVLECPVRFSEFPLSPHGDLLVGGVFFHFSGVPTFSCGCYQSFLLSVCSVKEQLVFYLHIEVGGLSSPLLDVIVEHSRLLQKGDPFVHHRVIGDGMSS